MIINTTLDGFLYANTVGFNPVYGKITPRPSGSLISREINQNMEKLISIGHSIAITENSETTAIEYNASFVIKTEDATLKLGTAFQGCQVTIVFAENGFIEYKKAEGNTKEKYKKNTIKKITYNGLNWIDTTPLQIPETNLTCDTAAEEEFKIVKIETILQQGKIPNNIELNIDFTNANSFGETTAATPTYPKLKITNAADEELGIYTICDSRGHYAGKGCWNSGDTMTFKIKGTKACITNSDVRETTSDYTIYSDRKKILMANTQNLYAPIDFDKEFAEPTSYGHNSFFCIRNGFCFVVLDFILKKNGVISTGLPRPIITNTITITCTLSENNGPAGVLIFEQDKMRTYGAVTGADKRYMISYCYPVSV